MKRTLVVPIASLLFVSAALTGCSGGGDSGGGSASTTPLTGNTAVQAVMVSSYQTFQGGLSYPLLQVEATLPPGSLLRPTLTAGLKKMLRTAAASPSLATSPHTALTYSDTLGLYDSGFAISGSTIVDHFYSDAAGTQSAGTLTVAYPTGTTITSLGVTSATAPFAMAITANITAGNLPIIGSGTIRLIDTSGAGEIKGNFTLTKTNVAVSADLNLSDSGNVTGTATITEHGQTIAVTQLTGPFTDNITGNVAVSPQGYTGTATLSIPNESFSMTLTSSAGTATSVLGSGGLTINFPDSSQEILATPLTVQPDAAPVTTGGGASAYKAPVSLGANNIPGYINSSGQITGQTTSGVGVYWSTPASTAQPLALYQGKDEVPEGLNNNGETIGFGLNQTANVVWSTLSATPTALAAGGVPTGVNDSGVIVGNSSAGTGVVWSSASSAPITLTPLSGNVATTADAINAQGIIVGTSSITPQTQGAQPVYWTSASAAPITLPGGTLGQFFDTFGVNSNGQIFASSRYFTPMTTIYWASLTSAPITLPSLTGVTSSSTMNIGQGINASGVIVGESTSSTGALHAVLWKDGKIQDLNDLIPSGSNWVLQSASSITDSGAIVGVGIRNGASVGFYLAPQ